MLDGYSKERPVRLSTLIMMLQDMAYHYSENADMEINDDGTELIGRMEDGYWFSVSLVSTIEQEGTEEHTTTVLNG